METMDMTKVDEILARYDCDKRQIIAIMQDVQAKYRSRRRAFDELFVHRPFDVAGSGAYRWAKTLERLDQCDPKAVSAMLRTAIEEGKQC